MPVYNTACPRNCYSTCSMRVAVKDGRLRMIEPNPDNLATPEGVCLKGLSYIERVYSSDRILHPLLRIPGSEDFRPITWDEAITRLSEKLTFFRTTFGPGSILYYTGSGTKGLLNAVGLDFWRLFGGCTTTYGDLCWPAGLEATRLTLGENKHSVPWDLVNARLIILWGKNSAETNIHQMLHINHALGLGAQLVVIDPRRTQSSEQANLFIQPRPGTDGVLALAIAKVLIRENFTDETFIKKYVYGYHQYKVMLQSLSIREAAEIADVPEEKIRLLAEMIGKIRPVSINAGFGMQRYSNSGQTMRAIIALLALTGNIGKPGAGWIYANLQSSIFNKVKDPLAFYPPEKPDGLIRVAISTAKLGQDMLKTKDPALKMIWVERGNPVTQNPDTHTVLKAFRALDFRVVVDQFMTDTAREADLILPAKTMFEQSDVIGAYWHPYIQIKQKIIDPPGEVKPETEIYFLLARHLGFEKKKIERFIPEPGDEGVNKYLKEKLREFPDLTLDRLKQGPVISPFNQTIAFKDMKFKTPSGRIELYSREAIKRWKVPGTAVFSEPVEASMRSGTHKNVYPLFFMTPNTKNRIHSQFNNLAMIRQFSEKPGLQMHPDDALSRKIRNGDLVRIYNDRGEVKVEVELDYSIRRGCVAMTNGWWITEGGTVNFLSCGRETDMGFGAAFHENLVEVERVR